MKKAIINADGKVVNLIEVEQKTLDADEWAPPAGHSHIAAQTDEDDKLRIGDTVHTATGRLKTRKAVPVPPVLPAAAILIYGDDEDHATGSVQRRRHREHKSDVARHGDRPNHCRPG